MEYSRISWWSWGGIQQAAPEELAKWKYYGLWTVVLTDRLLRLTTGEVSKPRYFGPLHRLLGRWLLYRYRRPEWCAAEYWTINPVTVLAWPLWWAWHLFEKRIVHCLLGWLFWHNVLVWPECELCRYRDLPKALWFTKEAKTVLAARRKAKVRRHLDEIVGRAMSNA